MMDKIKNVVDDNRKRIWFVTLVAVIVYAFLTGNTGVLVVMVATPIVYIAYKVLRTKKQ